jgi:hypothetical protein
MSLRGYPDFILCCYGRFVGLELKSQEGEPSLLQEQFGKEIREAFGIYLVAYPDNWLSIKESLVILDRGIDI